MKVYIVTEGSYSDYEIKRVFLDEEKAQKYKDIIGGESQVEEYETSDEEINTIKPLWHISAEYFPKYNKLDLNIWETSTDAQNHSQNRVHFNDYRKYTSYEYMVNIRKAIPRAGSESKKEIHNRYYEKLLKVSQDYWGIVKEQLANGATEKDINQMLSQKEDI